MVAPKEIVKTVLAVTAHVRIAIVKLLLIEENKNANCSTFILRLALFIVYPYENSRYLGIACRRHQVFYFK